jgi:hypothetical protein
VTDLTRSLLAESAASDRIAARASLLQEKVP